MNNKLVALLGFLFFTITSLKSQNLVVNGDFEEVNICEEYQETCAPVGWRSTSKKLFGYIKESDNRFVGLTLFNGKKAEDRKFAQSELICPLIENELYNITLGVKPNLFAINSICIGFSDSFEYGQFDFDSVYSNKICVDLEKQLEKGKWKEIQFSYTAKGGEKFICIGNLKKDFETSYSVLDKKEHKRVLKSYEPKELIVYGIDNVEVIAATGASCIGYEERSESIKKNKNRHTAEWTNFEKPLGLKTDSSILKNEKPPAVVEPIFSPSQKIVLGDMIFESNSYELNRDIVQELNELLEYLKFNKSKKLNIIGHTDSVGSLDDNKKLSYNRAEAIKSYMIESGIGEHRIEIEGRGETELLFLDGTEESMKKNRRVIIEIF